MNPWAWQFSKIKTTGVGARIADLETTGQDFSEKSPEGVPVGEGPHGDGEKGRDISLA